MTPTTDRPEKDRRGHAVRTGLVVVTTVAAAFAWNISVPASVSARPTDPNVDKPAIVVSRAVDRRPALEEYGRSYNVVVPKKERHKCKTHRACWTHRRQNRARTVVDYVKSHSRSHPKRRARHHGRTVPLVQVSKLHASVSGRKWPWDPITSKRRFVCQTIENRCQCSNFVWTQYWYGYTVTANLDHFETKRIADSHHFSDYANLGAGVGGLALAVVDGALEKAGLVGVALAAFLNGVWGVIRGDAQGALDSGDTLQLSVHVIYPVPGFVTPTEWFTTKRI